MSVDTITLSPTELSVDIAEMRGRSASDDPREPCASWFGDTDEIDEEAERHAVWSADRGDGQ